MKNLVEKSIGQIVAEDYRTSQVFEKHNIDFCCNGGRSLQVVAAEKNLDVDHLVNEIAKIQEDKSEGNIDFGSWPLDLLADYIVKKHHRYADKQIPVIKPYLDKITRVHGAHHPELHEIKELFEGIAGDVAAHMKKEEIILFPFIKKMAEAKENNTPFNNPTDKSVENPVEMLMHEHDAQGVAFRRIAELSNDYTNPPDGCNTYRVTLGLMKEFQDDLHKHIHLENNILFPKALELEKELKAVTE